ncbi:MAG: UxaA family hydrolase [Desulfobacterales bacterium]
MISTVNCSASVVRLVADRFRGEASVAELGRVIFRRMLDVASGRRTKSESLGIGNDEFVPWQMGAVM